MKPDLKLISMGEIRAEEVKWLSWSSLLLGLTALALTGGVLWAVWFSWEKLWNMMHTLIP